MELLILWIFFVLVSFYKEVNYKKYYCRFILKIIGVIYLVGMKLLLFFLFFGYLGYIIELIF